MKRLLFVIMLSVVFLGITASPADGLSPLGCLAA